MVTLNISVSDSSKDFIDAQVTAGGYSSPEEFVQFLIREAQKKRERAALEDKLLERIAAVERGEASEMTSEDWEQLRAEVLEHQGQP